MCPQVGSLFTETARELHNLKIYDRAIEGKPNTYCSSEGYPLTLRDMITREREHVRPQGELSTETESGGNPIIIDQVIDC